MGSAVFRVDSVAHPRAFEDSDLGRRALLEVTELVETDAVWSRLTGLEVFLMTYVLMPRLTRALARWL